MKESNPSGCLGFIIMGFALFALWMYSIPKQPPQQKKVFEVVDKYNGCDVVRYESGHYPLYSFLLDCKNKK